MEQGKIMEAEVPTVRVDATPTGLTAAPPPRFLQVRCPSCHPTNSVKALKAESTTVIKSELNREKKQNMTHPIDFTFVIPDIDIGVHQSFIYRDASLGINN